MFFPRHVATSAFAVIFVTSLSPAATFPPGAMLPNPPEKLQHIGSIEGMPAFPRPIRNLYPGGRLDMGGELVNYPGSIEHYTPNHSNKPAVNPYNHRTLVKNFRAVDLPGVPGAIKEKYAEPLNRKQPDGAKRAAVAVVRLKPGKQRLSLRLDPLPVGMYVVRVIAAIDPRNVQRYPKDLLVEMKINDGPQGEISRYVLRHRGACQFYSMGEFFFHVEDGRGFDIELGLYPDSQVDLLVHNIDVHDILSECAKRAGKTASIHCPPHKLQAAWGTETDKKLNAVRKGNWKALLKPSVVAARAKTLRPKMPGKSDAQLLTAWRARRDDDIWNSLPPMNFNLAALPDSNRTVLTWADLYVNWSKADPKTEERLKAEGYLPLRYKNPKDASGPWRLEGRTRDGKPSTYTLADLKSLKPYPGLPFETYAWGKRFERNDGKVDFFCPLALACTQSLEIAKQRLGNWAGLHPGSFKGIDKRDVEESRDLAMLLCRFAYDLPAWHPNRDLSRHIADFPSLQAYDPWWRFYQYLEPLGVCEAYDQLFPIIEGNQELASAVGRHIPWVKNPRDVITLLDTYTLQFSARQLAYWQNWYDHGDACQMARLAAYQCDPQIAAAWVDFVFSRTSELYWPPASIEDYMYLAYQRDGTTNIGSISYTFPGLLEVAGWLHRYVRNGGNKQYDLTDQRLYPRVMAGADFLTEFLVAGMCNPGIGDGWNWYASGRSLIGDKTPIAMNMAWRAQKNPRYARFILSYGQRYDETDEEWDELVKAAQRVRDPFMANRSRVLSDWGGVLEGGTASDDFRFRHAARIRVGRGRGHAHGDALDLGFWSMGMPVSICAGSWTWWAEPRIAPTASHNVVVVDRESIPATTASWVEQLSDGANCGYLRARAAYQKEFSRQVALIELDHGAAAPSYPAVPDPARHDLRAVYGKNVTIPRAYLFDVFRAIGGKQHTYNFHGFPEDAFETNAQKAKPTAEEQSILKGYTLPDAQWAADVVGDALTATWRLARTGKEFMWPGRRKYEQPAPEPSFLGSAFDPASPRKFLRVHLLGQKGSRAISGEYLDGDPNRGRFKGNMYRDMRLIRPPQAGEASSMFAAIWEPYAGKPVIRSASLEGDVNDAFSHAAVRVETADGISDLCFADSTHKRPRTLRDGTKIQADFAYLSTDAGGLRQASLVGGTSLESAAVNIRPSRPIWEGRIVAVDYLNKNLVLDVPLPAGVLDGAFFQVGAPELMATHSSGAHAARWTSFEATKVEPWGSSRTRLTWRKGAECYSGKIIAIERNPQTPRITTIKTEIAVPVQSGENSQLTLTNAARDRSWRCDVAVKESSRVDPSGYGGGNALIGSIAIYTAPVGRGDLKVGDRIYLHEFGKGDIWRVPTRVSLRRTAPGEFSVETNVPCEIELAVGQVSCTLDGMNWTALKPDTSGKTLLQVTLADLGKPILLRWRVYSQPYE